MAALRTPEEARQDLARQGISISAWAQAHGFSANLVFEVLAGRKLGVRGQSHEIAVRLGLKAGEIPTPPAIIPVKVRVPRALAEARNALEAAGFLVLGPTQIPFYELGCLTAEEQELARRREEIMERITA